MIALLLACSGGTPPTPSSDAPATPTRPDVVLVTLDTTRADRLGAWGHKDGATDWLDRKARAGILFQRAYSVQPLTIPSHASIFTGLWPFHHGVRSNGDATLGEQHETLAERMRAAGYQTAGSVGAFVTSRSWGFGQGFDRFHDDLQAKGADTWHQQRPADKVIDDAVAVVLQARKEAPLFLWVHLYDAHFPYAPPPAYAEQFPGRPYDGEIAFMDDQLARLEGAWVAAGRAAPLWVVIGDHGESLGEHRELTHGLFVYDATQHIPFFISGPGVSAQVVEQPVSQVDLLPTLLHLLDRPIPEGLDGRVQPGNPHPAWMESFQLTEQFGFAPHLAVVDGDRKLLRKPVPELYDLRADPKERNDLAATNAETVTRLQAIIDGLQPTLPQGRTQALDVEALARLQALGYVTTSSFDVDFANLPDPTLHRDLIGKLLRAEMHSLEREPDKALPLAREALRLGEDIPGVHIRVMRVLAQSGRKEEARAQLEKSVQRFPRDVTLLQRAAAIFGREGDNERALALARQAQAVDPEDERTQEYLVGALINLGRPDEALAAAEAWLLTHPESEAMLAFSGILRLERGDLPGAEQALRKAARAPRPRAGVCERLGALALSAGVAKDAVRWLQREDEMYGLSSRGKRIRVRALSALGRYQEALALADEALKDDPDDVDLMASRGGILIDLGRLEEAMSGLQAALLKHPEQADLLLLLANAQRKAGKAAEAEITRQRAETAHARRSVPPGPPKAPQ